MSEASRIIEEALGIAPSSQGSEAGRLIQKIMDEQDAKDAAYRAEEQATNPFYDMQTAALQQLIAEVATHGESVQREHYNPVDATVPGFKISGVRSEDQELWQSLYGRSLPGGAEAMIWLYTTRDRRGDTQLESVIISVDTYDWVPTGLPEVMEGA